MFIQGTDFQTQFKFAFIFLLCFVLSNCSSLLAPNVQTELQALKPGAYELDKKHSAVLFKIDHMGLSKFVGRFEELEASLDFDAENIAASSLQAIIAMDSVNVNNEKFARTLSGPKWFDAEQFPQAVFQSKSARTLEEGLVQFTGDLTFLGQTREVAVDVRFNGGANNLFNGRYTIGFEAHTVFKRSDFGLDKHLGLVGDEVEIEVYAEFMRIR